MKLIIRLLTEMLEVRILPGEPKFFSLNQLHRWGRAFGSRPKCSSICCQSTSRKLLNRLFYPMTFLKSYKQCHKNVIARERLEAEKSIVRPVAVFMIFIPSLPAAGRRSKYLFASERFVTLSEDNLLFLGRVLPQRHCRNAQRLKLRRINNPPVVVEIIDARVRYEIEFVIQDGSCRWVVNQLRPALQRLAVHDATPVARELPAHHSPE